MIPRTRKGRLLVAAAIAAIVIAAAAGAWVLSHDRPGDVTNADVAFEEPATTTPPAPPTGDEGHFEWPFYGFDAARTNDFPLRRNVRPPFKLRWAVRGRVLLEFGPVAGASSLYLLKNNGALYAIKRRTGVVAWKEKLGHLAASSPAYHRGRLYVTILQRGKRIRKGSIVAMAARRGTVLWTRLLPSRTESSPLVIGRTLYAGSENGTVYALRISDGAVRWTYRAGGAVKGGLAYSDGKLYFGDYRGGVHAVWARSGRRAWRVSAAGGAFGLGAGRFYATPAVRFGRVYLGNTNGTVSSFSTRDGKLAWRKGTGDYVYSSAAVGTPPGAGPTVYVGSYDGTLYALDARNGRVRWTHRAEGRISGAVQIVGDLVFYSTLNHFTTALGAATGRRIWTVGRGMFNPVISDGRYLFLNGSTSIFAYDMRPGDRPVRARPGDRPDIRRKRLARERARERARQHPRAEPAR
ncbi:MAG: PQQ-like beta-propeller repeat protein [Solirubrobacteraceae bacterium]|nr:PQQ-like beta-propeller repeat protein [Solirubrobacteraceae bacterium]